MQAPYTEWTRVVTFPYGTVVYDLDVSPDGTKVVAAFGEIDGKMDVRVFAAETAAEGRRPRRTSASISASRCPRVSSSRPTDASSTALRTSPASPTCSATSSPRARPRRSSNTETGFFRPIPLGDDQLVVFRFTGQGLVPARITGTPIKDAAPITFLGERLAEEKPVVRSWIAGSPAEIPWETLPKKDGVYRLAGGLKSESFYPIVQGYKDSAAVGMRWNLSDRLQLNRLSLSASYSPDTALPSEERVHLRAHYQRFDWRAEAVLNDADFYDLFGPTKTGRKGYGVSVGRKWTLLYDEPRRAGVRRRGRVLG